MKNIQKENLERNRIIHEIQKEDDTKKEYMLLGLRQIDGVKISRFKEKFGDNIILLCHELPSNSDFISNETMFSLE